MRGSARAGWTAGCCGGSMRRTASRGGTLREYGDVQLAPCTPEISSWSMMSIRVDDGFSSSASCTIGSTYCDTRCLFLRESDERPDRPRNRLRSFRDLGGGFGACSEARRVLDILAGLRGGVQAWRRNRPKSGRGSGRAAKGHPRPAAGAASCAAAGCCTPRHRQPITVRLLWVCCAPCRRSGGGPTHPAARHLSTHRRGSRGPASQSR